MQLASKFALGFCASSTLAGAVLGAVCDYKQPRQQDWNKLPKYRRLCVYVVEDTLHIVRGAATGAMGGFALSLCVPLVAPVVVPLAFLRFAREQDREGKQLEQAAQPA